MKMLRILYVLVVIYIHFLYYLKIRLVCFLMCALLSILLSLLYATYYKVWWLIHLKLLPAYNSLGLEQLILCWFLASLLKLIGL